MELQKLVTGRNNGFIYTPIWINLTYIPLIDTIKEKFGSGRFMLTGRDKRGRIIVIKKMVIR